MLVDVRLGYRMVVCAILVDCIVQFVKTQLANNAIHPISSHPHPVSPLAQKEL